MTSNDDLARALSPNLWGLLTYGDFETGNSIKLALGWLYKFKFNKNYLGSSKWIQKALNPLETKEVIDKRARSYRFKLIRIISNGVTDSLRDVVFDTARATWYYANIPESLPVMVGYGSREKMARMYYVSMRYCSGSEAKVSKYSGNDVSYIAQCKKRGTCPSDDFMIELATKLDLNIDWVLTGHGLPKSNFNVAFNSHLIHNDSYETILGQRQLKAEKRERIGLKGEVYVRDNEKERLAAAGRSDLADRVLLVSELPEFRGVGYDIKSFSEDGHEVHIEVKSTEMTSGRDYSVTL